VCRAASACALWQGFGARLRVCMCAQGRLIKVRDGVQCMDKVPIVPEVVTDQVSPSLSLLVSLAGCDL